MTDLSPVGLGAPGLTPEHAHDHSKQATRRRSIPQARAQPPPRRRLSCWLRRC